MAMVMVHLTPALDVCRTVCLTGENHRKNFHFRTSIVGFSSSRKEQRATATTVASFGNNPVPRRRGTQFRSWRVSAELQPAEDLRAQLEALQQEAEQVRSKAKSARHRFMRLSHVVEQLQQRAAMDVRLGNDDTARALLMEKQKVMKALEAARQRAELLEQLAAKLNVVISMKETLLIAALSSAPVSIRSEGAADDTGVHHVSPRTEEMSHSEEMSQSGVLEELRFTRDNASGFQTQVDK